MIGVKWQMLATGREETGEPKREASECMLTP
jgi:hypothetical protein